MRFNRRLRGEGKKKRNANNASWLQNAAPQKKRRSACGSRRSWQRKKRRKWQK
jgi:hypothetical protein